LPELFVEDSVTVAEVPVCPFEDVVFGEEDSVVVCAD